MAKMAAALVRAKQHGTDPDLSGFTKSILLFYVALVFLGVTIWPVFRALVTNLIWNNTRIGEHRIECRLQPMKFMWIWASNFVAAVFSLGFLIPWASVRLSRYQLSVVRLLPAGDLQEIGATEPENIGAVGAEAAGMFDFDIAL
jgi:uncharacterized membrane protein YjgN (DUF898 family)